MLLIYKYISTMATNKELDLGNLTLYDYNALKSGDNEAETV